MSFEIKTSEACLLARPHPDRALVELILVGDHAERITLDRAAVLNLTKELLDLSSQLGGAALSRR
jgi:hypothetical protein